MDGDDDKPPSSSLPPVSCWTCKGTVDIAPRRAHASPASQSIHIVIKTFIRSVGLRACVMIDVGGAAMRVLGGGSAPAYVGVMSASIHSTPRIK